MKKCLQIVVVLAVLLPAWAHSLPPGGEGVLLFRSGDTLCVADTRTWHVKQFPKSVWEGLIEFGMTERDSVAILYTRAAKGIGLLPIGGRVQAAFVRDTIEPWYQYEGGVWPPWYAFGKESGKLLCFRGFLPGERSLREYTILDPLLRRERQFFRPAEISRVWWGGDTTLYLRMADSAMFLATEPANRQDSLRIDRTWFVESVVPSSEGILRLERKGDHWRVVRCSNIVQILHESDMGWGVSQGSDKVLYESNNGLDKVQVGGDVIAFQEEQPASEDMMYYRRVLCYSLSTGRQTRVVDLTKSIPGVDAFLSSFPSSPAGVPSLDCVLSPDGKSLYIGVYQKEQDLVGTWSLGQDGPLPSPLAIKFAGIYEVVLSTGEVHRRVDVPCYRSGMQYLAGHTRKHWPVK